MIPTRLLLPLILAALLAAPALAGGAIEVVHPWARPSLPNRPGVVYLGIHNLGDAADRLLGARAAGAEAVELHKAEEKGGMMTMRPVEAIEIPAGGMAHLGPGGFHLMLFGLPAPLRPGETLELTLEFERAGAVPVSVPVMRDGPAQGDGYGHGQDEHDGGDAHQHGTDHN